MCSVPRWVKKIKKSKRLGEVKILSRQEYEGQELDTKVELIRSLIPLGLMHVQELLEEDVQALAGEWYACKEKSVPGRRYGSNPGSVRIAGQRVSIRVPRVRGRRGEILL